MRIVIAFTGAIGAGKTTIARSLCEARDSAHLFSFAGPLKLIAKQFGFPDEALYGTQQQKTAHLEQFGCSGRQFLQQFGTELMRNNFSRCVPQFRMEPGAGIWDTVMYNRIVQLPDDAFVMIDDMRFPNELEALRRLPDTQLFVIYITRPAVPVAPAAHESESYFAEFAKIADLCVENSGSIQSAIDMVERNIPALPPRELLLTPVPDSMMLTFDPRFDAIVRAADAQVDRSWSGSKIHFDRDFRRSMRTAPLPLRNAMAHILTFFGLADDLVEGFCVNLADRIKHFAVQRYLQQQATNETEHKLTYKLAAREMPPDWIERAEQIIERREGPIGRKIRFLEENMVNANLASSLFINVMMEACFSCVFNLIFYLSKMSSDDSYKFNDFIDANSMIMRDEAGHVDAFVALYRMVSARLAPDVAERLCRAIIDVETEFSRVVFSGADFMTPWQPMTDEALRNMPLEKKPFPGLSWDLVMQYNRYIGNKYMIDMGYAPPWPEIVDCPSHHMSAMSAENVGANFERSVSVDYKGSQLENATNEEIDAAMMFHG